MKNIKLILCDLDGTLLSDDKKISEHTISIIQKAREQGIRFGLATGRSLYAVVVLLDEWKIRDQCDVLLGFNGAQIIMPNENISELNDPIKGSCCIDIIHHFEDLPINFSVYDKRNLHAYRHDDLSIAISRDNRFTEMEMGDIHEFFKRDFPKLVIMCHPQDMEAVIERSKSISSPDFNCFKTTPTLFEFVNPKVCKSNGIKRICDILNITMDEVCVFGDAQNDHDMLKHAGLGVCMINGDDKTKSLSDDITDLDNNHDGVANYILKHFL